MARSIDPDCVYDIDSTVRKAYTVWRVIFGGSNFREKSTYALRINFRGCTVRLPIRGAAPTIIDSDDVIVIVCLRGWRLACYVRTCTCTPLDLGRDRDRESCVPSLFTKLWRGFLHTTYEPRFFIWPAARIFTCLFTSVRTFGELYGREVLWGRGRHQLLDSSDKETSEPFSFTRR